MPDYEIKCWDGDALQQLIDEGKTPTFVADALSAHKWAFASDWLRLYVMYNYGGIYLDSDILVYKSFDRFLQHSFFSGTKKCDEGRSYEVEGAIIGAVPGLSMFLKIMDYYKDKHLLDASGNLAVPTIPVVLMDFFSELGYVPVPKNQFMTTAEGEFAFYAEHVFINNIDLRINGDKGYYARHCNTLGWSMNPSMLLRIRRSLLIHTPSLFWSLQRLRSFARKDYRQK